MAVTIPVVVVFPGACDCQRPEIPNVESSAGLRGLERDYQEVLWHESLVKLDVLRQPVV